jgi:hypothetical protein
MPPHRSGVAARAGPSSRGCGDAGAGPSTSGRDHDLPAEVTAALDAFVELVPRLLRLPGPDGLPLQPPGVTATRRLTAQMEVKMIGLGLHQLAVVLQSHRFIELSALLLRGDVPPLQSSKAESTALEAADSLLIVLLQRSLSIRLLDLMAHSMTPFALQLVRADVPACLARSAAAAAEHLGDRDGALSECVVLCRSTVVLRVLA